MTDTAIVTGGAGFIGSHLVDSLLADGKHVVVVDDLSTGDRRRVAPEADLQVIDLSDASAFDAVLDAARPTEIFHLGAQSMVTVSVKDPRRDCRINVQGTLNVVEAAKRHGAVVTFTSTGGALYGDEAKLPTPETSIPAPLSPYGASKWAGEAYIRTWAASCALAHSVCRLGNVYGPRQSPHGEAGVVSILSDRLWRGEPLQLFGYGKPTRDYIHVFDVVEGLRRASGAGGVFNLATGVETDVLALFAWLADEAGSDATPELAPLREGELERSCMDPSHARRELGFSAKIGAEEGVRSTFHALIAAFKSGAAR